jgi:hypothetical protein
MAELTKQALQVENNTQFPNNNAGLITPTNLRTFNSDMIDSLVDEISYTADSASFNSRINNITGSATNTGSLLLTASFNDNTRNLTFTKGDASTFNVNIPDTSGSAGNFVTTSSFNAYTASTDSSITQLNASSASQQISINALNAATSSYVTSAITASSLVTASFSGNTLTFTKGDSSTFGVVIPDVSGSTGNFATTGSNTFNGTQIINGAVTASSLQINGITDLNGVLDVSNDATFRGDVLIQSSGEQKFKMRSTSGGGVSQGFDLLIQTSSFIIRDETHDIDFLEFEYISSSAQHILKLEANRFEMNSGSLGISGSLTASLAEGYVWAGGAGNVSTLVATSSFAGGGTIDTGSFATTGSNVFTGDQTFVDAAGNSVTLTDASGSLMLVAKTFTSASAHLSASAANFVNLIFKNNNNSGDTIISGSNNIFSNPSSPTTGYIRYIGGSNNLYLNSTINSQITASAASVSGNRPTMNNNIFNTVTNFTINQARNSVGAHDYSQNYFNGGGTVTINALAHTGSISMTSNTAPNGSITINASSASLAEIGTGISGSGTITIQSNFIQGATLTNTSPRFTGFTGQTASGNVMAGGSITVTNISASAAVNANNNFANGTMIYSNAGAAGLALHTTTAGMNTNYGAMNFVASASAISANGNISPTAMTVTNRMFSGSLGVGAFTFANNQIQGGGNTYTISGSFGGTGIPAMAANGIFGISNTIFTNVEGKGLYTDFRSNLIGGAGLILTGSNNNAITASGGGYFGRFNADDGRRNTTGENILVVGTGTSATARKTGFLIDSGSNSFFEGTLNVSGSTSLNGDLVITGSLTSSLQQGYVWVGNASGITTTVATSSFGGGGAAFPYTGDAVISGSLQVTGSFRGYVNALSVVSSTASIDMVNGNFFTLNLPTSSTTHIEITNIKAGQTINLQVSQSSANTGSIAFAPNIKFAGGFDYTATAITGALDLVSFVAFDANQILATSVKNLL